MSRASVAPGPRSLEGLEWLARVGASPLEPWGLVMGWRRALTYDHARRRLAAAGLVRTVRLTQGHGSLFVATAAGAARVGYPASWAVRSIGPSNWVHVTLCAWVSAWLQLRGHSWWSDREIAGDVFWQRPCATPPRGTARVAHRPDLAVELTAGPAAIGVEVQRKPRARLLAILRMYADSIDEDDDPLAGLLYVCDRVDIAKAVRRAAWDARLAEGPTLSVRTRDEVVEEARTAAATSYDAP